MRSLTLLATAVLAGSLTGCGGVEYRDRNAEVDARPECDGSVGRPGEPVPAWCDRTPEATWSSDSESTGIDFDRSDDED